SPPDRFIARRWVSFVGPLRAKSWRADDSARPTVRARYGAQSQKTNLRLRRPSHISNISPVATYRQLMERDANFLEAITVGNDPWWFGVPGRCLQPSSGDRRGRNHGIRSPLHSHA